MDVDIQRIQTVGPDTWRVHACGMTFTFSDQASAISFADKLKERVEAAHNVPEEVLQRWANEQRRLLEGRSS